MEKNRRGKSGQDSRWERDLQILTNGIRDSAFLLMEYRRTRFSREGIMLITDLVAPDFEHPTRGNSALRSYQRIGYIPRLLGIHCKSPNRLPVEQFTEFLMHYQAR
jgi:hypothetical protein